MFQGRFADIAIELNHLKTFWLDIRFVNGIIIHHQRPLVIDGLQEGISKSFNGRRIRDQVCLGIDIRQRIDFPPFRRKAARIPNNGRFKIDRDVEQGCEGAHAFFVVGAFVPGRMRDDQPGRQAEAAGKLDGVLDAFTLDDAGRLEDQVLPGRQAEVRTGRARVFIQSRRGRVKIHDVGNDQCGHSNP